MLDPPTHQTRRTARFSGKRQVPSFALLESIRNSGNDIEGNNAKGGSSENGGGPFSGTETETRTETGLDRSSLPSKK